MWKYFLQNIFLSIYFTLYTERNNCRNKKIIPTVRFNVPSTTVCAETVLLDDHRITYCVYRKLLDFIAKDDFDMKTTKTNKNRTHFGIICKKRIFSLQTNDIIICEWCNVKCSVVDYDALIDINAAQHMKDMMLCFVCT